MRVCLLASGSKGNSLFVESGDTKLLVDAGLSCRETIARLENLGVSGSDLHGIIVTHEHNDHIRGAGTIARKYKVPVFLSYAAAKEMSAHFRGAELVEFESGCSFTFRDVELDPFPITHDSADPVGFVIQSNEARIGIATDLGIVTRLVRDKLQNCRVLVLESNHDERMLADGPYPWHLKQRIKSRHGHLSNRESVELLSDLLHAGLEGVFLAHLSEINNHPEIALAATRELLAGRNDCSPDLHIGSQDLPSGIFCR